MEDLQPIVDKIVESIRRDVNNIFIASSGTKPLEPEHQDALAKYFKLLTDTKLANKERELEQKIARAEQALSGTHAEKALPGGEAS